MNKQKIYLCNIFFIWLILNLSFGYGQSDANPLFIGRYETSGSSRHEMSHYGYEIVNILKEDKDSALVVKLCSGETLIYSIVTSSANPIFMADFFSKVKDFKLITERKMFIEYLSDCQKSKTNNTASELWVVQPEYLISKKEFLVDIGRIKLKLYSALNINTSEPYSKLIQKMLSDIDSGLINEGYIVGFENNIKVRKKIKTVKKIIDKQKSKKVKILIKMLNWNRGDEDFKTENLEFWGIKIYDEPDYENRFLEDYKISKIRVN